MPMRLLTPFVVSLLAAASITDVTATPIPTSHYAGVRNGGVATESSTQATAAPHLSRRIDIPALVKGLKEAIILAGIGGVAYTVTKPTIHKIFGIDGNNTSTAPVAATAAKRTVPIRYVADRNGDSSDTSRHLAKRVNWAAITKGGGTLAEGVIKWLGVGALFAGGMTLLNKYTSGDSTAPPPADPTAQTTPTTPTTSTSYTKRSIHSKRIGAMSIADAIISAVAMTAGGAAVIKVLQGTSWAPWAKSDVVKRDLTSGLDGQRISRLNTRQWGTVSNLAGSVGGMLGGNWVGKKLYELVVGPYPYDD
ncbi:hypothetical protein FRB99_005931 [Tulasnella sp. 403]|nr:hypothetical protein FRB99_005931 [Tulasnella sp. 403]